MSPLGIAALALTVAWASVLSLGVILLIRQVGLLTLRLEQQSQMHSADGISIDSRVPDEVAELLLPGFDDQWILVLEAGCGPCREIVDGLHGHEITAPVIALIAGDSAGAEDIAKRLPPSIRCVIGARADEGMKSLDLSTTPFVFRAVDGTIAHKDVPRSAAHLVGLLGPTDVAHAPKGERVLEVTHVGRGSNGRSE